MSPQPAEALNIADLALLSRLVAIAHERHNGDLTVMRFSSNWRIGFGTPREHRDISRMPKGATFTEAAQSALADPRPLHDYLNDTEARFRQPYRV
ncbi:MAG TPA: hypothetical protein VFL55_26300 [Acetobacteraceae bacterium]|nr:hypothetical protein [Acetobacteraceae bacterium]